MKKEDTFYHDVFMDYARKRKKFMNWYKKGKEWREYLEKRKEIRKTNNPYYNDYYE